MLRFKPSLGLMGIHDVSLDCWTKGLDKGTAAICLIVVATWLTVHVRETSGHRVAGILLWSHSNLRQRRHKMLGWSSETFRGNLNKHNERDD